MNDAQLLKNFVEQHQDAAFQTLVERHLSLVFGTARRLTGDNALAEDITQTVFILLARKAPRLGQHVVLSGWLYRTTKFVTARALTGEMRRRRREQEAFTMQTSTAADSLPPRLGPLLDEALNRLVDTDRNAILLRYFEQQSVREVGVALGLNEEAAKKRLARALEKLRRILSRRGAEISVAALATGLASEAADAATVLPLAAKISKAVLVQTSAGAGIAAGSALLGDVLAALRWIKIKMAIGTVASVIAAALLYSTGARHWQNSGNSPKSGINASSGMQKVVVDKSTNLSGSRVNKSGGSTRTLVVTVLDDKTSKPIRGAKLQMHSDPQIPDLQKTYETVFDGTAKLSIPINLPGSEIMNGYGIEVKAPGYATRVMGWYSPTGRVFNIISGQRTVRLSRGITLAGMVVDETGKELRGIKIGAYANGACEDAGPAKTDCAQYLSELENNPVVTDASGRFKLENYPGEVHELALDLLGKVGDLHKFKTSESPYLYVETFQSLSFFELKSGTARLVIPRGIDVHGVVVDPTGAPVIGAKVAGEAESYGNPEETDSLGRFCLSNRPPHEVSLGVSARGWASSYKLVSIHPEMASVRFQLSPELPLHGRVVNEAGHPVPDVAVNCAEPFTRRFLIWTNQTDGDGQFYWNDVPTNELSLYFMAAGFETQSLKVHASTNELIVILRSPANENIHISGQVTDADSGEPLDHFTMKASHQLIGDVPNGTAEDFKGEKGEINIELPRKKFSSEGWVLAVAADGYDSAVSLMHEYSDGNQHLDFKLKRGGMVEGVVRTPKGESAGGANLGFSKFGPMSLFEPGKFFYPGSETTADSAGNFKIKKPVSAKNLIVFHDTGYAIVPIVAGPQKVEAALSPWSRIEGRVAVGGKPVAGKEITLRNLTQDFEFPLLISYRATSDADGRFVFDKTLAGIFKLSCHQEPGRWDAGIWQTAVTVAAGENKSVTMGSSGASITVQLRAGRGFKTITWDNASAVLNTDVPTPPKPAQNDFASQENYAAALHRYTRDPSVLSALSRQSSLPGSIQSDGLATFSQMPAGNYILEVKLYDPSTAAPQPNLENEPSMIIGHLFAPITVPESSGDEAPIQLGEYILEPL